MVDHFPRKLVHQPHIVPTDLRFLPPENKNVPIIKNLIKETAAVFFQLKFMFSQSPAIRPFKKILTATISSTSENFNHIF